MDWHNGSCRKLDLFEANGLQSCLSCGLTAASVKNLLPPISPERPEVRLLHLAAGSFSDAVQCQVVVESLTFNPEYIALSYTWADDDGNDDKCETILVNGEPFAVTKNCKFALRRARSRFSKVVIWVDAICIDQENDTERGHQVKLMALIYSRAEKVLVYIGESNENSRYVFRELNMDSDISQGDAAIMPPDFSVHALQSFLSRRYFTRVWILQEIALAKTAILTCGGDSMSWKKFVAIAELATEMEERPPVLYFNRQLCLVPGKELELLDMGRHSQATNPRDKVYALFGLLPNRRIGGVEVDYTLSIVELYSRVALELATSYDWSNVLERAGASLQNQPGLPSWVPDWSCSRVIVLGTPDWDAPYERGHWVRHEIESGSINILAVLETDLGHERSVSSKTARCKVVSSLHRSSPSTYIRIRKHDKLAAIAKQRYKQIAVERDVSFPWYFAESYLVLDLLPKSDGATWTLWRAFWEEATHVYIPSDSITELFYFTKSDFIAWEIESLVRARQRVEPQSSTPAQGDDLASVIARSMSGSIMHSSSDLTYLFHPGWRSHGFATNAAFSAANGAFLEFLKSCYQVEEEWINVL